MLSILIPIYNFHCIELIEALHQQGKNTHMPFEVVCLDDGSDPSYNNANCLVDRLEFCHYHINPQNLGRSKSRNKLARIAQFPNLLFIDCDSKLTTNSFVQQYINAVDDNKIIYGGRIYTEKRPVFNQKWMHWKYGTERESRSIQLRQANPYKWFHSNNFVIPKRLFMDTGFDESITKYGYEDSLLAAQFKSAGTPIVHIDNPVVHLDIMDNEEFLHKAQLALINLHNILKINKKIPVRLAKSFIWSKKTGLQHIIKAIYNRNKSNWEAQIINGTASLRLFDWYRLGYLLNL